MMPICQPLTLKGYISTLRALKKNVYKNKTFLTSKHGTLLTRW